MSDHRLEEPSENAALFRTLAKHGFVPDALRLSLEQLATFRDMLVHGYVDGYVDVNPAIVRDVVENRLGDLEAFVGAIRARLTQTRGRSPSLQP